VADILEKILAVKAEEIAKAKAVVDEATMRRRAEETDTPRDFVGSLRRKISAGLLFMSKPVGISPSR